VLPPKQIESSAPALTTSEEFTVMVYVTAAPEHPLAVGITEMVATTGDVPVLVPLKEGMFPVPDAGMPMDGSVLVHAKVVPEVVLVKEVAATLNPLQTAMLAGTVTLGVGFTVMVYVLAVPTHPLADGVTVMVAEIVAADVLVALKEAMSPVPDAAIPIAGFELVHA
jgi:hypothetical protein